jgi:rhodanese-related sulfurtransferase
MFGDGRRRHRAPVICPALGRHLAGFLLVALIAAGLPPSSAGAGGNVSVTRAYGETGAGERLLIDVRSPQEWRQTGLPQGARTVTIHQRATSFLDGILAAASGDKDKPIALICATGMRSKRAQQFLETQGFTNVVSVDGGLFGTPRAAGWMQRGLPMEPCRRC